MSEGPVLFYENQFYILSNFSSFQVEWKGKLYPTSEHVYHSEKFEDEEMKEAVRLTRSAHDALKFANSHENCFRRDWHEIKLGVMKEILRAKVAQHEYVRRKLLETGDRVLIENSWRDPFWGWGPNGDGHNHLGRLWMEVRTELRSQTRALFC